MALPVGLSPDLVMNVNIGVLGHVDSGKTSLVKALSTLLSTAALDKNPQSIARGITLDLGFSAFLLPLPPRLQETAALTSDVAQDNARGAECEGNIYKALQFTLVDCPGHASLIRTIIGGAQIIDMMILVVNVLKGIQTQTAECLVIGEITTRHLIVVLNKVDLLPDGDERTARVSKAMAGIRAVLKDTKFAGCPIVATAAAVGGERIGGAATNKRCAYVNQGGPMPGVESSRNGLVVATSAAAMRSSPGDFGKHALALPHAAAKGDVRTLGLEALLESITESIDLPTRDGIDAPFFFSIDHCFPIKGKGTVVTGTVLSGSVKINDLVEIPQLRVDKKVKSMQVWVASRGAELFT